MKTTSVLCLVCALVASAVSGTAEQKLKNCNEVRVAYSSKGFNVNDVPNKGVSGEFVSVSASVFFTCVLSGGSWRGLLVVPRLMKKS